MKTFLGDTSFALSNQFVTISHTETVNSLQPTTILPLQCDSSASMRLYIVYGVLFMTHELLSVARKHVFLVRNAAGVLP